MKRSCDCAVCKDDLGQGFGCTCWQQTCGKWHVWACGGGARRNDTGGRIILKCGGRPCTGLMCVKVGTGSGLVCMW